jgi:hypothetical protein
VIEGEKWAKMSNFQEKKGDFKENERFSGKNE